MHRLIILLFIITLIASPKSISSDIEYVIARWNPTLCKRTCPDTLQDNYDKRNDFMSAKVKADKGETVFVPKPNKRLTYQLIKNPMKRVGVGLSDLVIKVRGKISEHSGHVYLTSSGDNTKFHLISPSDVRRPKTRKSRELSEPDFNTVMKAKNENKNVEIEGVIFLPHRPPPMTIEIAKLKTIENSNEHPKK